MRDFHKLQERQGVSLTGGQLYGLLAGALALAAVAFGLGYSVGLQKSGSMGSGDDPLIPPDVQNESVALMLARAVEEEVDAGSLDKLELKYSDILPSKSGEGVVAPLPDGSLPGAGQATPGADAAASGADSGASAGDAGASRQDGGKSETTVGATPGGEKPGAAEKQATDGKGRSGEAASTQRPEAAAKKEEPAPVVPARAEAPKEEKRSSVAQGVDQDPTGGTGSGFTVQVSSHPEPGLADRQVRQLIAQGFPAYRVEAEVNGQRWYRVRVGTFTSQEAAEKEMQRLRAARSELKPMIAHR